MREEDWISVMEFIRQAEKEGIKITYRILRRYIEKGIFPKPRKIPTRGNVGYYSKERALNQLRVIKHLESSGYYTSDQIKEVLDPFGGSNSSLEIAGTGAVLWTAQEPKVTLAAKLARKIKEMKNRLQNDDQRYWVESIRNIRQILHRAGLDELKHQKAIVGDYCHLFIREEGVDLLFQKPGVAGYVKITVTHLSPTKVQHIIDKEKISEYIARFRKIYREENKNRYFKIDLDSCLNGVARI